MRCPKCRGPEACLVRAREHLDVICSEVDLAAAETELSDHPDRLRILSAKLAGHLDRYEFVLMDCPPSLGVLTLNALAIATEVLVSGEAKMRTVPALSAIQMRSASSRLTR